MRREEGGSGQARTELTRCSGFGLSPVDVLPTVVCGRKHFFSFNTHILNIY